MGPERGMTVSELIEELRGLPQGREIRFYLGTGKEEPLASSDIRVGHCGGDERKVLLCPTSTVEEEEQKDDRCAHASRCCHFEEA